jgi:putative ABC transport system permease protein
MRMNLSAITQRLGLTLTVVIAVACAVGVLVAMLAMGAGAHREAMGNVRPDRIILMSVGAQRPMQSNIAKDVARLIRDLPGIRRNSKGEPIAVAQVLVFVRARKKVTGTAIGFALAGVSPDLTDYLPELRLTSGRMYQRGLHELIATNMCARQFADFTVGDKRLMHGAEWLVVGNFDIGRAAGTCVVYADADTVLSTFGRGSFNQVNIMLEAPTSLEALANAIKANPMLRVEAKSEAELTQEGMKQFNGILNFVSYFVGAIMAVAATIGAANSFYAVVDGRRRELAILYAIGFGPGPVIASVLSEAILLALPGALIGTGLAWILFNGLTASPFGFSFRLAVTSSIVTLGIVWALIMGLIGGLLPAIRAARVPVTTALRAN